MSGMRATTPMKSDLARQIRATAGKVDASHPEMVTGQHLRHAATMLQSGQTNGAKRHLDAAMELMTPRNLMRHGITDDEGHATAKTAMHQINVHRLGVQDIEDTQARNEQQAGAKKDAAATAAQAVAARQAAKTQASAAAQAAIEARTAAKPTGKGPGSQQQTGPVPDPILATSMPRAGGIELTGPGGWSHGWIRTGEASSLHGKIVVGRAKGGVLSGRYDHASGTVTPRHGSPIKVLDVMPAGSVMPAPPQDRQLHGLVRNFSVELSAQTARLAATPAPYGKPGGPGLYGKAGNKHSDYFEQIVKALMEKRGMDKAQASAIAWGALRKWRAGGGNVHPEVRAAAAGALGKEAAAGAHLAADPWDAADRLIELACPVELAGFNPAQPRTPAGTWGSGGGAAAPGGGGSRAQRRAKLVKRAVALRGQITALLAQIHAARHGAHHSKSSTPKKKGAGAASAKAAAASKRAAKAKTSTRAKSAKSMTLAQMHTRLAVLRAELHTVMQQIHQL